MKSTILILLTLVSVSCASAPAAAEPPPLSPAQRATLDTIVATAPTSVFAPTDIEGQWASASATITPHMAAREVALRASNRSRASDEESTIRQTCKVAYGWSGLGTDDEKTVRSACKEVDYPLP